MIRDEYVFEDTNFAYDTNFAGEYRDDDMYPERNGSRSGNIVIPSKALAAEMYDDGFNVKWTKGNVERGEEPEPYIKVSVGFIADNETFNKRFKSNPKKIGVLGADGYVTLLHADTIGILDRKLKSGDGIRIKHDSVCCVARPYINTQTGKPSLWVSELYVEQDVENEHWGDRYKVRPMCDDYVN
jgi:hypothetical protein